MLRKLVTYFVAVALGSWFVNPAFAVTPAEVLDSFRSEAAKESGFEGFSSERGEHFFKTKYQHEMSCATCHTENPAVNGKHSETDKLIKPLAPAINEARFSKMRKVKKWFKRNCKDVLDRECTAQEKGDVLAYLISVK